MVVEGEAAVVAVEDPPHLHRRLRVLQPREQQQQQQRQTNRDTQRQHHPTQISNRWRNLNVRCSKRSIALAIHGLWRSMDHHHLLLLLLLQRRTTTTKRYFRNMKNPNDGSSITVRNIVIVWMLLTNWTVVFINTVWRCFSFFYVIVATLRYSNLYLLMMIE